jgi:KTSC domain-containing protein
MRRGTLEQSELIQSIGWKDGKMEIKYRDDSAVFIYFSVPFSVYMALKRSKNPGHDWLKIRDQYTYREV